MKLKSLKSGIVALAATVVVSTPIIALANGDDSAQGSAPISASSASITGSSDGTSGSSGTGADGSGDGSSDGSSDDSSSSASSNPFTVPGNGTVVDEATSDDGKHFYTIQTEDGNVFYIIVDDQRTDDNVYMTHFVSEDELLSFVESEGTSSASTGTGMDESSIFGAQEETTVEEAETPVTDTPQKDDKDKSLAVPIIFGVVILGAMGFFYFKFGKDGSTNQKNKYRDDFDDDDEDDDFDSDSDEDIAE